MPTIRTSQSHPLQVNSLAAGSGRLGLTLCPGKQQPRSLTGGWARDLDLDLAALREAGAGALVTLMPGSELRSVGVSPVGLGAGARAAGLEWHHLPIRDVDVPDAAFEEAWCYAGPRLHRHLQRGALVVLHCLGGLGRSGTIAARLLVEQGESAATAIARVRAARPGAIETPAQESYVHACRSLSDPTYRDRALGCLLGGAVGDALGYCVEFDRLETIRARFGPEGIREPIRQDGRLIVSDDTQMTLFTLEGLLRSGTEGEALEFIRLAYGDWLHTQGQAGGGYQRAGELAREPVLHALRAPGNTCLSALRAGGRGAPDAPLNHSKGCGGAMRVAPIGLLPDRYGPAEAFQLAARAAALTHGHPSGYWSAAVVAGTVRGLLDGAEPVAAITACLELLRGQPGGEETLVAVTTALELAAADVAPGVALRRLGEGWVGEEAVAVAVYAALKGDDFPRVLAIAANHDGDSDSTAAIAGQLYGAWKGLETLPHDWVVDLDVLAVSLRLARGLFN